MLSGCRAVPPWRALCLAVSDEYYESIDMQGTPGDFKTTECPIPLPPR